MEPTTTPSKPVLSHSYWFGYFLSVVSGIAQEGNPQAISAFKDFCERGEPTPHDLKILARITDNETGG